MPVEKYKSRIFLVAFIFLHIFLFFHVPCELQQRRRRRRYNRPEYNIRINARSASHRPLTSETILQLLVQVVVPHNKRRVVVIVFRARYCGARRNARGVKGR